MIHACECSAIYFGGGASPAIDFLLQLPPVVILAMTDIGCCSDNKAFTLLLDFMGWLPVYMHVCVYYAVMHVYGEYLYTQVHVFIHHTV